MSDFLSNQDSQSKLSVQMRAVLLIFEADPYLKKSVFPFINIQNESIRWDQIFRMSFGSGHRAAVTFAYSIWTDEIRENSNPFEAALSMSVGLQQACLKALALRWGLLRV